MRMLSIVIPTINEVHGIGKTLGAIPYDMLKSMGFDTEVLIIDGGSSDGTIEKAKSIGANVITDLRKGYGRAYKTGFEKANGEIIATLDADNTYPAESIPELIRLLDEKSLDFITTDRFAKMDKNAMSIRNKFGNSVLSLTAKALLLMPFNDSQSGMWVFRKSVWDRIKDKVKSDGMAFSQEIKIEAYRSGAKCFEEGITYRKREGEVKLNAFKDGIKNLANIFGKRIRG